MIRPCKHCGSDFNADQTWKTMCIPCYIKWKKASEEPVSKNETQVVTVMTPIPDDMVNRLIRLCHPDRHNNSEASNTATKWLLDVRKKQREAA
jgi:hypothetical protein